MTEIQLRDASIDYASATLDSRSAYILKIATASTLLPRTAVEGAATFEEVVGRTFYLAEIGSMMGIHPLEAISQIHLIEGKPTLPASLMSAQVRRRGHKLRVTESGTWKAGDYAATCVIIRKDDPEFEHVHAFGFEDAEMAGLLNKANWKKYPKSMCIARAISKCARAAAEDALGGAHYTPEELGATVNEDGVPETVDYGENGGDPIAPAPAPEAAPAAAPAATPAPAAHAQAQQQPAQQPMRGTAPAAVRPASEVTDEEIINNVSSVALIHAKNAFAAAAQLDVDALGSVYASAQSAKVLNEPGIDFALGAGQPRVYARGEDGTPMMLGAMMRAVKVEILDALAEAEAAAQDEAAEAPQNAYPPVDEEPQDAEEVTESPDPVEEAPDAA